MQLVRQNVVRRLASGEAPNLGGLAQLGEQLLCKQKVSGSNPLSSTKICVGEYSTMRRITWRRGRVV